MKNLIFNISMTQSAGSEAFGFPNYVQNKFKDAKFQSISSQPGDIEQTVGQTPVE